MDKNKLLRYSIQLAMLKQIYMKNLITQEEYKNIEKRLMKDYGVVSNITT